MRLVVAAARPTFVVRTTTTWAEYPSIWRGLLDEVYAAVRGAVRGAATQTGGGPVWQNVMLYTDDGPTVEVGVLAHGDFDGAGRVIRSTLPAGEVASTVYRGSYADLDRAHQAVAEWCRAHGRRPAGPRWEVYGHWQEDPAQLETEVTYLLG